ncbi:hypothetical protein BaRGS_00013508 [Batillaria attramentaria]|uniref:Uncharacterized protein n=1 Tax=Batillaria attramentaria TaxID=370345 RepID=A0ABD0L704_9CAEN
MHINTFENNMKSARPPEPPLSHRISINPLSSSPSVRGRFTEPSPHLQHEVWQLDHPSHSVNIAKLPVDPPLAPRSNPLSVLDDQETPQHLYQATRA